MEGCAEGPPVVLLMYRGALLTPDSIENVAVTYQVTRVNVPKTRARKGGNAFPPAGRGGVGATGRDGRAFLTNAY